MSDLARIISERNCAGQEPLPEKLLEALRLYRSSPEAKPPSLFYNIEEVVGILGEMNLDARSQLCAVLAVIPQDVISRRLISPGLLSRETADILLLYKRFNPDTIPAANHDERLHNMVLQMVNVGSIEPRILFIKMAFLVARFREAKNNNFTSLPEIAEEALKIYAPLAHRFGFFAIKSEFENAAFQILYPDKYAEIQAFTGHNSGPRQQWMNHIKTELEALLAQSGVNGEVAGRIKEFYSIYKKTVTKNLPLNRLFDIVAFRILVPSEKDCYALLGLVHDRFEPLNRFKDYINAPKANGYRSLHTTVADSKGKIFEVQIRDYQMHFESETGIAAHWSYKENKQSDVIIGRYLGWIRNLNELLSKTADTKKALNLFEGALSKDHIFVFTPNGQIIRLPRESTVIDFAFAIHSEVGFRCAGARINGKFVNIRTVLKNGDQVDVITNKSVSPSADWIDSVHTKKAKQYIRYSLFEAEKNELNSIGLKRAVNLLKKMNLKFQRPEDTLLFRLLQKKRRKSSPEELYRSIATEGLTEEELRKLLERPEKTIAGKTAEPTSDDQPMSVSGEKFLKIKDQTFIPVRFAKCCNPEQPASIVGIADGQNMVIHRADCVTVNTDETDEVKKIILVWDTPNRKIGMDIDIVYNRKLKTTAKIFSLLAGYEEAFVSETLKRESNQLKQTLSLSFENKTIADKFCKKLGQIADLTITVKSNPPG